MMSELKVTTSATASTTAPSTVPRKFRIITTVKSLYSTLARLSFMRRSTIGTITPRKLITPLINPGELTILVGTS